MYVVSREKRHRARRHCDGEGALLQPLAPETWTVLAVRRPGTQACCSRKQTGSAVRLREHILVQQIHMTTGRVAAVLQQCLAPISVVQEIHERTQRNLVRGSDGL